MYLGDGYSLKHIRDGWGLSLLNAEVPVECPRIGFSCWHNKAWLACAAFYPTTEWMIAEYLVFGRHVPWRMKSEAFKRSVPFMLALCEAHGKRLLVPSSSKGVTAILRNMGVAYSSGLDLLVGP